MDNDPKKTADEHAELLGNGAKTFSETTPKYVEILHKIPAPSYFTFDFSGRAKVRRSDVDYLIRTGWLVEYRGYVYFSCEAIRSSIDGRLDRFSRVPGTDSPLIPLAFVPPMEGRSVGPIGRIFRWLVGWPKHDK